LAGNLVENAIRHNVTGGTATVSVFASTKSRDAVLEVENTGPVLDPESIEGLVEPFRRAGPDRASNDGGVGLGLSIVNAVVTAHHGTMTLTARQGGGLRVRVQLPVTSDPRSSMAVAVADGSMEQSVGAQPLPPFRG
jgi:signal transduction histidine kinase